MLIINGVEVDESTLIFGIDTQQTTKTKTDNYVVPFDDTGMLLVMNSSSNKTFTLPAADAAHIGCWFDFANINTGRMTIIVTGTGVQLNNGTAATGTFYSDDDYIAITRVKLVSATKWSVMATGTWTTT
jgi:hypothetical protein